MSHFNKHDEEVFKKISEVFSADMQSYLADFDFSYTGRMSYIDPVFSLEHYINTSDYEFISIDTNFVNIYSDLKVSMKNFLNIFSINTSRTGNDMFHVAPSNEFEYGDNVERFKKEADEINVEAKNLYNTIRKFILEGKKRIDMSSKESSTNTTNVYGDVGNVSTGDGNTLINTNAQTEYDEKLDVLIAQILESSMQDKEQIVKEINTAKESQDKNTIMRILGGLLNRGAEAAGFIASIASIMSLW